ncbi:MAG: ATP phosphoribosyltransferase regulatory subunit [Candidatus Thermoplasmatota archaeon]|nr:ATP phosphoribosyltransferase regulatory subunit [Candidatus Thermoplasmatota archaeon]MBS3789978.1 ATP phosphoribosyltransferase regulatory subunit [Candidatus Thermoplasmatota archaeon]
MKKDVFSESERLDIIVSEIREILKRWGYQEIFLPSVVEHDGKLRKGLNITCQNEFYSVNPDPTSQMAVNFRDGLPIRKFYIREILDGIEGKFQAGIEFLCDDPVRNKVEILNILISILERLKIEDFYVDIGSLKIWKETIENIKEYRDDIFTALRRRNLSLIDDLPISSEKKEELWDLLNLRGEKCGFDKIDRLIDLVDDDRFYADLGTVRPLPYYDDIIFEIYSPRAGFPIGAGGEYKLEGTHGCGFALDLEMISEIYNIEEENDFVVVDGDLKTSYRRARGLVEDGEKVRMEI